MRKYLTELIGTFFLVLTIGCTVIGAGPYAVPPLAIGCLLVVMVYAGGHISGAHYNPAVTLAIWMRGRCAAADVLPYWAAQMGGAILAAVVVRILKGDAAAAVVPTPHAIVPAFLAELLFTFALAYVVLNVATSKETSGNSYFGLAIGFTVLAGAFAVGNVSGGALNPAVAVGASVMRLFPWSQIWLFLVPEMIGAALAAVVFKLVSPHDL